MVFRSPVGCNRPAIDTFLTYYLYVLESIGALGVLYGLRVLHVLSTFLVLMLLRAALAVDGLPAHTIITSRLLSSFPRS